MSRAARGSPRSSYRGSFDRFRCGAGEGGFDLGLAIAKAAVDAVGGSIEIDSREGEIDSREGSGTSVRVRLAGTRLAGADAARVP